MAFTTINDPSEYFHIQLYTGNASDDRSITNDANAGDFKPDWLWIKQRNTTRHHTINDSNRGATKNLGTSLNNAESTGADGIQAFETDGFQLGTDTDVNQNSGTYVAWQWVANGGTTSSNSSGDITSTVQDNTTAGLSIVTYTGNGSNSQTVGHGLGVKPEAIIVKNRDGSNGWRLMHKDLSSGKTIYPDATDAETTDAARTDLTSSTLFTLTNNSGGINANSNKYVAYCLKGIPGYSQFGTYKGNGNNDGVFVYLGFKPALVIFKRTDSTSQWNMIDNKRGTYDSGRCSTNGVIIKMNSSGAEETNNGSNNTGGTVVDFLSNGFKHRNTEGNYNNNGGNYIYLAWAEHPFVSSTGVPRTAVG